MMLGGGGPGDPEVDLGAMLSPADKERLQRFLESEQHKSEFNTLCSTLTDKCWELCLPEARQGTGDDLSNKERACIQNCAVRWIEVTAMYKQHFIQQ